MATCDDLTADILIDCDNPPSGGANDRLILFNYDDINGNVTIDGTNSLLFTNITLASGVRGFVFEGLNNSNEPRAALVKGRYVNGYDHEVIFKVFLNSPAAKAQLKKLDGAKVVALVQNNHKGEDGNAAFEIYGYETGLRLQELERVIADSETQGAYNVNIRNDEVSRPSSLPQTLWDTDFATTKAIVDSLIV
jgi:hypothetical protein